MENSNELAGVNKDALEMMVSFMNDEDVLCDTINSTDVALMHVVYEEMCSDRYWQPRQGLLDIIREINAKVEAWRRKKAKNGS